MRRSGKGTTNAPAEGSAKTRPVPVAVETTARVHKILDSLQAGTDRAMCLRKHARDFRWVVVTDDKTEVPMSFATESAPGGLLADEFVRIVSLFGDDDFRELNQSRQSSPWPANAPAAFAFMVRDPGTVRLSSVEVVFSAGAHHHGHAVVSAIGRADGPRPALALADLYVAPKPKPAPEWHAQAIASASTLALGWSDDFFVRGGWSADAIAGELTAKGSTRLGDLPRIEQARRTVSRYLSGHREEWEPAKPAE